VKAFGIVRVARVELGAAPALMQYEDHVDTLRCRYSWRVHIDRSFLWRIWRVGESIS
jgi:hypothetical protein